MFRRLHPARLLRHGSNMVAPLDAELLLRYVLEMSREQLIAHPETPVGLSQRLRFLRHVRRRARGVPLAYLTGHKEFFGLDFLVDKHTLIPRPETETLVELALEEIRKLGNCEIKNAILADIGTGGGCIPIAITKTLKHKNTKTLARVFALDISRKALQVAKKNAKRHQVDITFLHGNLLEPFSAKEQESTPKNFASGQAKTRKHLVVTANLPYLTAEQYAAEPSIQFEPRSALVAANKGLALYEELLKQIQSVISKFPNFQISLFMEIDPSQSTHIIQLVKQYLPHALVEIKKDLAGRDRVVCVRVA